MHATLEYLTFICSPSSPLQKQILFFAKFMIFCSNLMELVFLFFLHNLIIIIDIYIVYIWYFLSSIMISLAMAFLAQIIWMILTTISNATATPREIEMERMISVSGSPGQSGNSGQTGQSGHSAQAGHSRGFSEEWLNWELIDTKTKKNDHKLLWYLYIGRWIPLHPCLSHQANFLQDPCKCCPRPHC